MGQLARPFPVQNGIDMPAQRSFVLRALPDQYAVCQLPVDAAVPADFARTLASAGGLFVSVTRTASELSIVCPLNMAPAGARVEGPWQAYAVDGTLDFAMVGVLVRLTTPLAGAGISVFAVSTFDTDYLLVPAARSEAAVRAWLAAGLGVVDEDAAPG